jgi:hypothetical protein
MHIYKTYPHPSSPAVATVSLGQPKPQSISETKPLPLSPHAQSSPPPLLPTPHALEQQIGMDEKTLFRVLPQGMSKQEAVQLITRFRELDMDGSGKLGFEEVLRLLMEFFKDKIEESNIRRLAQMQFQVADADKVCYASSSLVPFLI